MSRDDGFAVMDVSTDICHDPKFRRLQRERPEHVASGFLAYMSTAAESWKSGRRVAVEEAWPALIPFDAAVCDSLRLVGLLDRHGLVSSHAWRGWFKPALERRLKTRARWTRWNEKRAADTTLDQRGTDAVMTPTVRQSVSPSEPSVPTDQQGSNPVDERHRGPRLVHPEVETA